MQFILKYPQLIKNKLYCAKNEKTGILFSICRSVQLNKAILCNSYHNKKFTNSNLLLYSCRIYSKQLFLLIVLARLLLINDQ